MSDETYREEHAWVPDALGHVRWTLRQVECAGADMLTALRTMADVIEKLAAALTVTDDDTASELPEHIEQWKTVHKHKWSRETAQGHIWFLELKTTGEWLLTLNLGPVDWEQCPMPVYGLVIGDRDITTDALADADTVIGIVKDVPRGMDWMVADVFTTELHRGTATDGNTHWRVKQSPGGSYKLHSYNVTGEPIRAWFLVSDGIPAVLEEAEEIIARDIVTYQRSLVICQAPGPRIAGEDD
jgi:hypothetical protein